MIETGRGRYGTQMFKGINDLMNVAGQRSAELDQECLLRQGEHRKASTCVEFSNDDLEHDAECAAASAEGSDVSSLLTSVAGHHGNQRRVGRSPARFEMRRPRSWGCEENRRVLGHAERWRSVGDQWGIDGEQTQGDTDGGCLSRERARANLILAASIGSRAKSLED